ncbi:HAD family hydrolase [Deinococcus sp.]|uniref:HAD family hydrolase n=1 Tax=Deinococcus sp. TaxID=47478 RepID=UPI0025DF8077|nr:HAD family hydrolase [Deinococcus sp.]
MPRPLLVLDLDETLWCGVPDSTAPGGLRLLLRPHLREFLEGVSAHYDLAVWTAASEDWMREGLTQLHAHTSYDLASAAVFLWHRGHCTVRREEDGSYSFRKPARKFKVGWIREHYPRDRILAVDDQPANYASGYGHLVRVSEWMGDPEDDELLKLAAYLVSIVGEPDLRRLEKRGWRGRVES